MKAFPLSNMAGLNQQGMDLRDYFAAKAMQGFAADPEVDANANKVALTAYKWADAMLEARK